MAKSGTPQGKQNKYKQTNKQKTQQATTTNPKLLGRWRISLEAKPFELTGLNPVTIRLALPFSGKMKGFEYVAMMK